MLGHLRWLLRLQELDLRISPELGRGSGRQPQLLGEVLVEDLLGPMQQETKPVVRQSLFQTPANHSGRMVADLLGRRQNTFGGLLLDREPVVYHAIDGRDADAGGVRNVLDSWTATQENTPE